MKSEPLMEFASHHRLTMAIIGAISLALIMTIISMSLYVTSGTQVLDLSRPGFESARQAINETPYESETFAQDGPINPAVVSEFSTLYKEKRQNLDAIDDFANDEVLGDENLRLTSETN